MKAGTIFCSLQFVLLTMTQEDVPGLVIEPGSAWTRAGIAGDIAPRIVTESAYARIPVDGAIDERPAPIYGDAIHRPVAGLEIYTPVIDGVVHDWDAAAVLWKQMAQQMGFDTSEQPLLLTEEVWNPTIARAKALETAFETLNVPLFTLLSSPLCVAFESVRTTALVVQVGAATASVSPVVDGVVYTKASLHTRFAGNFVNAHLRAILARRGVDPIPAYQVRRKQKDLKFEERADLSLLPRGTDSFHEYELSRLFDQMKQVVCQVSPVPLPPAGGTAMPINANLNGGTAAASANNPAANGILAKATSAGAPPVAKAAFELPSGYHVLFGAEREYATEALFRPSAYPLPGVTLPENSLGLSELIYQSLTKTDAAPEVIVNLLSNIVICGGGSMIHGLPRRIENDLLQMLQNRSPKFYVPTKPNDRRSVVWAAASVLGSLGLFDSSWITRAEFEETGATQLVEKRFK